MDNTSWTSSNDDICFHTLKVTNINSILHSDTVFHAAGMQQSLGIVIVISIINLVKSLILNM